MFTCMDTLSEEEARPGWKGHCEPLGRRAEKTMRICWVAHVGPGWAARGSAGEPWAPQ